MKRPPPWLGFTIIEPLVVVCLIGVLATLTIANLNSIIQRQAFTDAVSGTMTVFLNARFYAIRTGSKAAVSIENSQIVAFVDANSNELYDAGEVVIDRYPDLAGSTLPANISIDCITLRERGTGPRTAFFDARGFYIDVHDGVSRHNANICLVDSLTNRSKTVALSPFGNVALGPDQCDPNPFVCPNVAPD